VLFLQLRSRRIKHHPIQRWAARSSDSTLLATAGVYLLVHPAVNLLLCVNPFLFLSLLLSHFRFFFTLQKQILFGWVKYGRALQANISWFRPPFFFVFVVVSAPFPIQQSVITV
jgi:hypothetical protein